MLSFKNFLIAINEGLIKTYPLKNVVNYLEHYLKHYYFV
jgi:hypothetical protein